MIHMDLLLRLARLEAQLEIYRDLIESDVSSAGGRR